jgi:hypothetical protein
VWVTRRGEHTNVASQEDEKIGSFKYTQAMKLKE